MFTNKVVELKWTTVRGNNKRALSSEQLRRFINKHIIFSSFDTRDKAREQGYHLETLSLHWIESTVMNERCQSVFKKCCAIFRVKKIHTMPDNED